MEVARRQKYAVADGYSKQPNYNGNRNTFVKAPVKAYVAHRGPLSIPMII